MLEKKRMQRENNRAFGERGDEGLELDESTLMGGGDSFQAQYVDPILFIPSSTYVSCPIFCPFLYFGYWTRTMGWGRAISAMPSFPVSVPISV